MRALALTLALQSAFHYWLYLHELFVLRVSAGVRANASLLDTCLPDATGTRVLSEVCVATPVLPSGRRCSRPAGREKPGPRNEQIGLAAGRRDESRAEGEGKNGGSRKSTKRSESGLEGQQKDS